MDGHDYSGNVRKHEHGGITWVDVRDPGASVLERLEREYDLHPLHVRESVQRVQHNQVERERSYLFLVMHFPILDPRGDKIRVGQIGVFLGKNYVITIHGEHSPVLDDMFAHCTRTSEMKELRSSGYLLYVIISKLLANIEHMTELVDAELDEIDGLVFDSTKSDAERIGRIRQKIVRLRRLIGPKRSCCKTWPSKSVHSPERI